MNRLLVETVVVTRPASKDLLQSRLDERLAERARREKLHGTRYGRSISDHWLEQDINLLQAAIHQAAPGVEVPRG